MASRSPADGRVAYAPGVFDLFHIGHLNLLSNARRHCDHLIAGVLTDDLAATRKGRPPTVPFLERLAIVGAIRVVDQAEPEDLTTKVAMWERLRFDVIVKGDDWRGTPRGIALEREMASVGAAVVYVPYTRTTSSSLRRALLLDRAPDGLS